MSENLQCMRHGGLILARCQMSTQQHSHFHSSAGQRENKMKKLMSQGKDREIVYHLLLWAKQTQMGENKCDLLPIKIELDGEKQNQIKILPSPHLTEGSGEWEIRVNP